MSRLHGARAGRDRRLRRVDRCLDRLGLGVATLAVDGVRYAAAARMGPLGATVSVAINLALGLVIIGLKAGLGH